MEVKKEIRRFMEILETETTCGNTERTREEEIQKDFVQGLVM